MMVLRRAVAILGPLGLFCSGLCWAQAPQGGNPKTSAPPQPFESQRFIPTSATIQGFASEDGGVLLALHPNPVPKLTFEDQFQKTHRIHDYQGDILVLFYGDRASADANRSLGETIHLAFHPAAKGKQANAAKEAPPIIVAGQPKGARTPDVHAIPVAVVGKVPNFTKPLIQNRFRAAVSDTSVWLDFDDRLKQTWGIVDGQPNLVVVDSRGRSRTKGSGKLNPAQIQQLVDTIEVLRREALGLIK